MAGENVSDPTQTQLPAEEAPVLPEEVAVQELTRVPGYWSEQLGMEGELGYSSMVRPY